MKLLTDKELDGMRLYEDSDWADRINLALAQARLANKLVGVLGEILTCLAAKGEGAGQQCYALAAEAIKEVEE